MSASRGCSGGCLLCGVRLPLRARVGGERGLLDVEGALRGPAKLSLSGVGGGLPLVFGWAGFYDSGCVPWWQSGLRSRVVGREVGEGVVGMLGIEFLAASNEFWAFFAGASVVVRLTVDAEEGCVGVAFGLPVWSGA